MFKKSAKEVPEIDTYEIKYQINNCKKTIKTYIDKYGANIDADISKLTNAKRDKRISEVERLKGKLRWSLSRQEEMQKLMDTVDSFEFKIDDAFAKIAICKSMTAVASELSKAQLDLDLKSILKQFNSFSANMSKQFGLIDSIMGGINGKLSDIDSSKTEEIDSEINSIVNQRLAAYDEQTTEEAEHPSIEKLELDS